VALGMPIGLIIGLAVGLSRLHEDD
jgi:hypothetical protein